MFEDSYLSMRNECGSFFEQGGFLEACVLIYFDKDTRTKFLEGFLGQIGGFRM